MSAEAALSLSAPPRRGGALALLALLVGALALLGLALGPARLTLEEMAAALSGAGDPVAGAILTQIRAPRVLLGAVVGAGLALSGAALQGVLRNSLADPALIGVTGGGAVGAALAILLGGAALPEALRPWLLPLAAFCGAALATALIFRLARRDGATSVATLILAGVAVNAMAGAAIGAMLYLSDDAQLRDLTFWTMGGLNGAAWTPTLIAAAVILPAGLGLATMRRALDLLQLGERAAFHAGLDIERAKRNAALFSALAVGAGVAVAGPIGFIGLVAPHLGRLLLGPGHRLLIPAAALLGAALVLAADLAVRLAVPPAEPPIGLATSLIGGPFFLWLILSRMRRGGYA